MLRFDGGAATHVGAVRKVNQDRLLWSGALAAIADGMGGHLGGEQAATIALEVLDRLPDAPTGEELVAAVEEANAEVFVGSEQPELRGMGTTLVAAAIHAEAHRITLVNVGDSRAYRVRDGELHQLTDDHSLVAELVRQGRLDPSEAADHPQRNIVTRALGLADSIEVDVFDLPVQSGDRLLLCSDGLVNEVDVERLVELLVDETDPTTAAERLVEEAVELGGRDNVSVVVVDLVADTDGPEPDRRDTRPMLAVEGPPPDAPSAAAPTGPDDVAVSDDEVSGVGIAGSLRWILGGVAAVVALVVAALVLTGSSYVAADRTGEVVILRQGRLDLLGAEPSVEVETGIAVDTLTEAATQKLRQEIEWESVGDAEEFVANLERRPAEE